MDIKNYPHLSPLLDLQKRKKKGIWFYLSHPSNSQGNYFKVKEKKIATAYLQNLGRNP